MCHRLPDENGGEFKKCGRCRLVSYCSRECQKKDWKRHKDSCEDYRSIRKTTDPFDPTALEMGRRRP